eukprot:15502803-Heterocapsa_arctica.AAC.1
MDDFANDQTEQRLMKAPAASAEVDDKEPGTGLAPPACRRPLRRFCGDAPCEAQADETHQWRRG